MRSVTEDYCKLASGIILSTIWREDDHTRILWITMLAVKDRQHRVKASIPGLAAVANIPLESVKIGLAKLMAPDEFSRTKEHEGRRVAEIEDGWLVLNGEKYRNYLSKAERNEYQRKLMAERRAASKALAPVSKKLAPLAQAEAGAEADTKREEDSRSFDAASPSEEEFVAECKRLKVPVRFAREKFHWQDAKGWPENWRAVAQRVKLWSDQQNGRQGEFSATPTKLPEPPPLSPEELAEAEKFQQDAKRRGIKLNQGAHSAEAST